MRKQALVSLIKVKYDPFLCLRILLPRLREPSSLFIRTKKHCTRRVAWALQAGMEGRGCPRSYCPSTHSTRSTLLSLSAARASLQGDARQADCKRIRSHCSALYQVLGSINKFPLKFSPEASGVVGINPLFQPQFPQTKNGQSLPIAPTCGKIRSC